MGVGFHQDQEPIPKAATNAAAAAYRRPRWNQAAPFVQRERVRLGGSGGVMNSDGGTGDGQSPHGLLERLISRALKPDTTDKPPRASPAARPPGELRPWHRAGRSRRLRSRDSSWRPQRSLNSARPAGSGVRPVRRGRDAARF